MSKRKLQSFSLQMKEKLIKEVDEKRCSRAEICRKYGIAKSTLWHILSKRDEIVKALAVSDFHPGRKRMRTGKYESLENALFLWFKYARAQNIPVSGPKIMEKATELAQEMGIKFNPNGGWLDRFKQRRGISHSNKREERESVEASKTGSNDWALSAFREIFWEYDPRDIFSADETALFYQNLPTDTLDSLAMKAALGSKAARDCLSILVGVNLDGSEKLPLLVIGKHRTPPSFRNITSLPVHYTFNKKAWMTSSIFESWLRQLDEKFVSEGRRVVVIVDSCPSHVAMDDLRAINLVFLPTTSTSILQPCEQGIIRNLKQRYRRAVIVKLLLHLEKQRTSAKKTDFSVDILDALYMLRSAWAQVTPELIASCFRYAGFTREADLEVDYKPPAAEADFGDLFERLQNQVSLETTLDLYLSLDETVHMSEELTQFEIVSACQTVEEEDAVSDEDENVETPAETSPTISEARTAMGILMKFVQSQQIDNDMLFDAVNTLDDFVDEISLSHSGKSTMSESLQKTPSSLSSSPSSSGASVFVKKKLKHFISTSSLSSSSSAAIQ